jgi:putative transcriptional regulator
MPISPHHLPGLRPGLMPSRRLSAILAVVNIKGFTMNAHRSLAALARGLIATALLVCGAPAPAAEPASEPVILVASPALRDRLYGSTILIAKPVGNGQHMGFIVNRPTRMTLGRMFPDHEPSQKVTDPIYLGGPVNTGTLFALVKRRGSPGNSAVELLPDLHIVVEREQVDGIIEGGAEQARFFAGLVLWSPGELHTEIERGFWYVHDADASVVLRKSTTGMWEELVKRSQEQHKQQPPVKGLRTSL